MTGFFKRGVAATALACAMLAAMPAAATVITITHTGLVTQGTDDQGQFGAAGANLVGQGFTLVFSIDTATASHDDGTGNGYYPYDQYAGPASASFTLNGVTKTLNGGADGNTYAYRQYFTDNAAPYYSVDQTYADGQNYVFDLLQSSTNYFTSLTMTTPFTYTTTAADRAQSSSYGYFRYNGQQFKLVDYTIASDGGQAAPAGAVPEPGVLGLLGLGLVAVAVRRKRAA